MAWVRVSDVKNQFSCVVCTAVTRPATLRRAAVPVTKGVNKIVAVFFFMGLAQRKGGNFEHAGSRHPFSIERANRLLHHVQVSIALLFVRVAPHDGCLGGDGAKNHGRASS